MKQLLKKMVKKARMVQLSRRSSIQFKQGCDISMNSSFEGGNVIHRDVFFHNSSLGKGSYIGHEAYIDSARIGRYCSIGPRVKIIAGHHPTRQFVSTHPAFYSLAKQSGFTYVEKQCYDEMTYVDEASKHVIHIGHDVWIGADAHLIEGVTIGDGAIVGVNSLVTEDVPAYSIVVGSPARVIRYRFDPIDIEFLLQFCWWERPESWLKENAHLFQDIKQLRAAYQSLLTTKVDCV